jgi:hypothetical protein
MFEYFVLFALGFALGVVWAAYRIAHDLTELAQKFMAQQEPQQDPEMQLRVEQSGNMIYCYEKDTDQFVAQGTTVTEIFDHFRQRFPGRSAEVVDGPDDVLSLLREQNQQRKKMVDPESIR